MLERLLKSEMRAWSSRLSRRTGMRGLCTDSNVQVAVESLAKLPRSLVLVPGEELVGRKPEARVRRFGIVEGCENKLHRTQQLRHRLLGPWWQITYGIFSCLERDIIAELVEADESVTEGSDAFLAQSKGKHSHTVYYAAGEGCSGSV